MRSAWHCRLPVQAGELFVPGVFRTDLPPATFNPTAGRSERLRLDDLLAE